MQELSSIERRAARIKLLLMDCDGVLTDGRLWLIDDGDEQKSFNVRDGLGLDLWHRAGLKSGIISGRNSSALGTARPGSRHRVCTARIREQDKGFRGVAAIG